jgi:hypothetical protein
MLERPSIVHKKPIYDLNKHWIFNVFWTTNDALLGSEVEFIK